ncbi:aldo/keto reductase [Halorarum salinum]|uniref:Aldo/keto reductase n=1 Tax=Halorarum salinum TaxID=2743089 RepID=A0A7D5LD28_9EURY|nr:aldo/keto reductase [Halobaculum salinum]QLG64106.1 aldo/keto reductase [Halobaculum salinum]
MPMLGLGTWQNDEPEECRTTVETALNVGYRHVDTAQAYGNEEAVGEGIARADVDREDVFLATKVWIDDLAPEDVRETARASLDRLGVDLLDLLYVHWPVREYEAEETLGAFDDLYDEGLIDRVGVSNFLPEQVAEAAEIADAPIFANQVECHPLLRQEELRETCAEHDVEVVAYSPLARGEVFEVDVLTDVAEKHDASAAQVSLAWLREKGVTAIPKATSEEHIRDNWGSLGLDLDGEDVAAIDDIDRTDRRVDPDFGPWNRD